MLQLTDIKQQKFDHIKMDILERAVVMCGKMCTACFNLKYDEYQWHRKKYMEIEKKKKILTEILNNDIASIINKMIFKESDYNKIHWCLDEYYITNYKNISYNNYILGASDAHWEDENFCAGHFVYEMSDNLGCSAEDVPYFLYGNNIPYVRNPHTGHEDSEDSEDSDEIGREYRYI